MAALICTLFKALKGARVASSRFLIAPLRDIRTARKLYSESKIRLGPSGILLDYRLTETTKSRMY